MGVLGFVTTVVSLIIGIEIGKWHAGSRSDLLAQAVGRTILHLDRAAKVLNGHAVSPRVCEVANEAIGKALDELRNGKQRAAEKELYGD